MSLTPVTWSLFIDTAVGVLPNSLIKTDHDNQDTYTAAARSVESIAAFNEGAGVQFYFTYSLNLSIACGLVKTYTDTQASTMDFGIANRFGACRVWELGSIVFNGPGFDSATDLASIIINAGGFPEYQKNGVTFYTSLVPATYPLFVKGALMSWNGAELTDVNIVVPFVPPPVASLYSGGSSGVPKKRAEGESLLALYAMLKEKNL